MQNLGGRFVVFFLRGQNRNFVKVRGLKLQLNIINNNEMIFFFEENNNDDDNCQYFLVGNFIYLP